MSIAVIIGLALALSFLCESMVEYLFGSLVDHVPALDKFRWLLMYIAAIAGVGLCFYYQLDLISIITQEAGTTIGIILSGLIIGRGANFVHQFISDYLP